MERRPRWRQIVLEAVSYNRKRHPLSRSHFPLLCFSDIMARQMEVCIAFYAHSRILESSVDNTFMITNLPFCNLPHCISNLTQSDAFEHNLVHLWFKSKTILAQLTYFQTQLTCALSKFQHSSPVQTKLFLPLFKFLHYFFNLLTANQSFVKNQFLFMSHYFSKKMIGGLFIYNHKGEVLLSRLYRQRDLNRGHIDAFRYQPKNSPSWQQSF